MKKKTLPYVKEHSNMVMPSDCNPHEFLGVVSIKQYDRIIYFENSVDSIQYIDFVPHKIESSIFYIIPAGHCHYLPHSGIDYYCLDILNHKLTQLQKQALFKIKYIKNKSVKIDCEKFDQIIDVSSEVAITLVLNYFIKKQNILPITIHYLEKAWQLNQFIAASEDIHSLAVCDLAQQLCISEKTLLRLCKEVFGQTPKSILRYHLYVLSIAYVLNFPAKPFSEIAEILGFKETSTFNRCIKTMSGQSPGAIRYYYACLCNGV
jgi:AraC-like DNA-binding protein